MSTPESYPPATLWHPFSKKIAVDLAAHLPSDQDLDALQLRPNIFDILFTNWTYLKNDREDARQLHFTVISDDIYLHARDIILLALLLDSNTAEIVCEIYFHTFYLESPKDQPPDAPKLAIDILKALVRNLYLSTVDILKWVNHPLGKIIRFTNLHTLNSLHHTFRKYDEYLTNQDRREKLRTTWLEQRATRLPHILNPNRLWYQDQVDANNELEIEAMTAMCAAHEIYWRLGSLFVVRDLSRLAVNPLFVFRKGAEGWGMDPNCNPLVGFMDIKSIVANNILWQPIFHLQKGTNYTLDFLTKRMFDTIALWGQAFRRAANLDNLRIMVAFARPLEFCQSIQPINKQEIGTSLLLREVYGNHERDIQYMPPMKQIFNMIDARDVAKFLKFYNVFLVTESLLQHNEQSLLVIDITLEEVKWVDESSLQPILGVRPEFFCDVWRFDLTVDSQVGLPWTKQYIDNDHRGLKNLLWRRLPGKITEYDIFEKERDYITEKEADKACFNTLSMMCDCLASRRLRMGNYFANTFASFAFLVRGLFARQANQAQWEKALAKMANKFKYSNEFLVSMYLQGFLRFKMPCDCKIDEARRQYPMLLCISIGLPVSVIHEKAYRVEEFWEEDVQVLFMLVIKKKEPSEEAKDDKDPNGNGTRTPDDVNEGSETPSWYEPALEEERKSENGEKIEDEHELKDGGHETKDEMQVLEGNGNQQEDEKTKANNDQTNLKGDEKDSETEREDSDEKKKTDNKNIPFNGTQDISIDDISGNHDKYGTTDKKQSDMLDEEAYKKFKNGGKYEDTSGKPSAGNHDDKRHENVDEKGSIDEGNDNEDSEIQEDLDLTGLHCIHNCKRKDKKKLANSDFPTQFHHLRLNYGKIVRDNTPTGGKTTENTTIEEPTAENKTRDHKYIYEGAPTLLYNKNEWTAGKGGVITLSCLVFPAMFEDDLEEYEYQIGLMENKKGVGDCIRSGSLGGDEVVFSTSFPHAIEEKVESKRSKKKKRKKQSLESLAGKENQQVGTSGGDGNVDDAKEEAGGMEDTSFASLGAQEDEKVPVFISGKEDKWSVFMKTKQGFDIK
ncbi:hypothetical protein TWF694_005353 [Orbilia ellipsospora]|uniref:DUF4470 domain-containing protein n=1 Tax=Orbilia ellipsospora TaxID=2528407 RepID=A0AAV9WVB9_9PEZI